jgi:hypothetical protein
MRTLNLVYFCTLPHNNQPTNVDMAFQPSGKRQRKGEKRERSAFETALRMSIPRSVGYEARSKDWLRRLHAANLVDRSDFEDKYAEDLVDLGIPLEEATKICEAVLPAFVGLEVLLRMTGCKEESKEAAMKWLILHGCSNPTNVLDLTLAVVESASSKSDLIGLVSRGKPGWFRESTQIDGSALSHLLKMNVVRNMGDMLLSKDWLSLLNASNLVTHSDFDGYLPEDLVALGIPLEDARKIVNVLPTYLVLEKLLRITGCEAEIKEATMKWLIVHGCNTINKIIGLALAVVQSSSLKSDVIAIASDTFGWPRDSNHPF